MTDTLSLTEVKTHLSEIVDRVEGTHDRVVLTRNGRPAAVLVSPDDLAALEDTLELVSNPEAMAQIRQATEELGRGEGITGDELRAKYLSK